MRNVMTNSVVKSSKRMSISIVALVLASVMLFGCVVGVTLAWLTARSEQSIKNVFVLGDIDLKLVQTGIDDTNTKEHPSFFEGSSTEAAVPALVQVGKDSVKSYIFIEIIESASFSATADYEIATGWTQAVTPVEIQNENEKFIRKVYYRVFEPDSEVTTDYVDYSVFANDSITPKESFGSAVDYEEGKTTLEFRAYAIQYNGVTSNDPEKTDVEFAWECLLDEFSNS